MPKPRPKSIVLRGNPQPRPQQTYESWQAEQMKDQRSPEERGIKVGSSVMWRHRENRIIITERAIVTDISGNTLTLLVKDVQARTCTADIHEIVSSADEP